MAGITTALGSVLNVVVTVATGLDQQVTKLHNAGMFASRKMELEGAKSFLEESGFLVPDNQEDMLLLAFTLGELQDLVGLGASRDSKQNKRLLQVKAELLELHKRLGEQA